RGFSRAGSRIHARRVDGPAHTDGRRAVDLRRHHSRRHHVPDDRVRARYHRQPRCRHSSRHQEPSMIMTSTGSTPGASRSVPLWRLLLVCMLLGACTSVPQQSPDAPRVVALALAPAWDAAVEERILALDPEHISDRDVRATLAVGPTPRMILLHGAIYPSFLMMTSFAKFLEGMGYPAEKLRDPADSSYSQSPYGSSERLAGEIAWYYEHDGMHPMLIGQSLGGMLAVKVLYELQGAFNDTLAVWDPYSDRA